MADPRSDDSDLNANSRALAEIQGSLRHMQPAAAGQSSVCMLRLAQRLWGRAHPLSVPRHPPPLPPTPTPKPALSLKPRAAAPPPPAAATPKKPHTPKPRAHGRPTQKAPPRARRQWAPPPPRRVRARTLNRARRRRRLLARTPRVARIRLGFHTLHHAAPRRRGRRARLAPWLRAKLRRKGELRSRRNRALRVIRGDAARVRREAEALRGEVGRRHRALLRPVDAGVKPAMEEEVEKMRERLNVLDVQSEVNLPEVRWSVANAMADMSIPSHRHLVEQRWRKEGDLDLLMERIHQMHVIPDVLPALHPSIDVQVTARLMPDGFNLLMLRNRFQRRLNTFKRVVPGRYLTPQQARFDRFTRVPPKVYANVFHTDVRLYTMLLVDPDVPDEGNQTFTTYLHWMKPNIPLSATHKGRIPFLNTHTRYVPPHPQRGTPYHRYVLLLLPQPALPGHRHTRNTEALLTAQQAALTQSLRDTAANAASANANTSARAPRHRPTHPNAQVASAEAQLERIVTLSQRLDVPVVPEDQRRGFDVRAFVKEWGINAAHGGGAHMWREVWDKYVGGIYRYELHQPQPVYGRPPKPDVQREVYTAPTRQKYHDGV
ncbi:hypothetical protein B0H10DRAFT_2236134 [Mycena sp. CBHHK59/15]|nr:hypothetical protein B0H10DRAFT_2236134 [Mycena sp. CBHHK59/15]